MSGQPQGVNSGMAARNCRPLKHQAEVEKDHPTRLSAAPCCPPSSQKTKATADNTLNRDTFGCRKPIFGDRINQRDADVLTPIASCAQTFLPATRRAFLRFDPY
jgi:hypothetical protein